MENQETQQEKEAERGRNRMKMIENPWVIGLPYPEERTGEPLDEPEDDLEEEEEEEK